MNKETLEGEAQRVSGFLKTDPVRAADFIKRKRVADLVAARRNYLQAWAAYNNQPHEAADMPPLTQEWNIDNYKSLLTFERLSLETLRLTLSPNPVAKTATVEPQTQTQKE